MSLTASINEAYKRNDFQKCLYLLKYAKKHSIDENERLKILANTSLCEAKYKGRIYHIEYRNAILVLFPELKSVQDYSLRNATEAVAAFNLALNAFVRGRRKTAIELVRSIMAMENLPDDVFLATSLFAIEMSLTLCQPKLALKQAHRLRENPIWKCSCASQRDYLDILEYRIRCRLAQTVPSLDLARKPQTIHYCLIQSELDMKNGNASKALQRLFKFRLSAQDEERRIIDNAVGCIYALSLKKHELAETYFRSAMTIGERKRLRSSVLDFNK